MERIISDYIEDILANIYKAIEFTRRMDYESFEKDDKTVYAVIRALEIIGEATGKIPVDYRKAHPDLPWKKMTGMRNILIHAYFQVDRQTIWLTVKNDLPGLVEPLERIKTNIK